VADTVVAGRDQVDFAGASGCRYSATWTSAQPDSNPTQILENTKACFIWRAVRRPERVDCDFFTRIACLCGDFGDCFGPLPSGARLATDRQQILRMLFGIYEIASPCPVEDCGGSWTPDSRRTRVAHASHRYDSTFVRGAGSDVLSRPRGLVIHWRGTGARSSSSGSVRRDG
jgi:hypothetical protein